MLRTEAVNYVIWQIETDLVEEFEKQIKKLN